ncbi:P-loop containing nucleoside triphosphate hydrolase protein [Coniella lustricola]|uniref:P-loop containing nucleoside triphosphate hydrolase protein n=1 Tax=Coniella lustricola TaxID=2025994 RepID=A0A2T3AHJ9_9PEZI|nr:P-loop containing nucleoside triphosphate hydrolase protein [Coniella lustricola]
MPSSAGGAPPSSAGIHERPRGASTASTTNNTPPIPISITICGDGGCGKSSITLRLVRSAWTSDYDPTIEDSYSVTRRIDGATYHLAITDTAGQEEYRGMWATSNLGADAFLMVYDITSPASLDALGHFNDLIDMESETRLDNAARARLAGYTYSANAEYGSSATKTVPPVKFVAGNKCDLSESRQVSAATGLDWARKRGCGFMETSARVEVNIEETFGAIVRRVAEARRLAERGILPGEEGTAPVGLGAGATAVGATKPLTPLSADGGGGGDYNNQYNGGHGEKGGLARGVDGPRDKVGRGGGGFWRMLRCW